MNVYSFWDHWYFTYPCVVVCFSDENPTKTKQIVARVRDKNGFDVGDVVLEKDIEFSEELRQKWIEKIRQSMA